MAVRNIHIGTSGWMYKHWNGFFYPDYVSGTAQLPYFAKHFDTVEINNTFYRLPQTSVVKHWHEVTPKNFIFAVKLNNFLTHRKRLIIDDASLDQLDKFIKATSQLGSKAKALLIQLPPNFKINLERLDKFLELLQKKIPIGQQICCEFRHGSWEVEETYDLLKKHGAAYVIATKPGKFSDQYPITSETVYIRYHATARRPDYSESELNKWAVYVESLPSNVRQVLIYFNNDFAGWAITNARYLKAKLKV